MDSIKHVVFVHGLLGFGQGEVGQASYWGDALDVARPSSLARPHEAIVGPLSSAHDRACELAAQIKGTRVDYGKEHSEDARHKQWGRDFSDCGFVPDWSEGNPVHLVGHSLGAPTIRCLQHLLEEDYWGWGSNHRWIRSISTISGVNNGTTAVYLFGADEESGLVNEVQRGDGLFWFFTLYVNVTKTSRIKSGLAYDLKLEQWGITRRPDDSPEAYMERVAATDFLKGSDHGFYSVSIQAALDYNRCWRTYPDTYYFSYVTEQTHRTISGVWLPEVAMNPALLGPATYMGQKSFDRLPLPAEDAPQWWQNDGLVPAYAQLFPRIGEQHPVGIEFTKDTPTAAFEPGRWHYEWEHGVDHLDICILPQPNQRRWREEFYTRLLGRLADLPL